MKLLSIDIETFSSTNLAKSGGYRYAESPDFEILLFGYSVDSGPVRVVDLSCGEKIPAEILRAIKDETVTKWAFNANFERICLSRFMGLPTGEYLNPASWKCSMVWAATMGLPLSLEGVGAVLKLDKQKLTEGKDLIRYFCQPCTPTAVNGQRTRNLPQHAPDKWAMFKRYNARDVETEMAVQEKLSKFPVPDSVWEEYHLDQEINDRGVGLDMTLVRNAISIDSQSRAQLTAAMKHLTDLENPNSVHQMKQWLADNGMETDSLGKKAVVELLKTAPMELAEALALRQQLAKSSVRKYQAMENAVCADRKLHGMFRFCGANRTGRWCLTGDHEILTRQGWRKIASHFNGKPEMAVYDSDSGGIQFEKCKIVSFDYSGDLYLWESKRVDQFSTPEHRNLIADSHGAVKVRFVADIPSKVQLPVGGQLKPCLCQRFTDNELRLLTAYQADGIAAGGSRNGLAFRFTKERKIRRIRELLSNLKYPFIEYKHGDGVTCIRIPANKYNPLIKTKQFGWWLMNENADVFFDELGHWDGHIQTDASTQYVTTNRLNAEIVATFAHLSGRAAIINPRQVPEGKNWSVAYYVEVWDNVSPKGVCISDAPKLVCGNACKVFCAETSTGFFVVRRNKKIWITGNSSTTINIQNLPQNHLEDLAEARALVRCGDFEALEMLYEDVPDTLSQLIRTAFVPKAGNRFIVADFSAIEARVIAWLAGEQWRQDVFTKGGDIYCASASQMFKVPVEKHGVNGHLRQKGKVAELACIAEGSLVLTDQGLIPIERVTITMRLWDGCDWVKHEGVIYKRTKEVIEYEGLRATPDHLVWVEGKAEPVQFGDAAASGAHLVQTGDGWQAIRLGEDYQPREALGSELAPLPSTNRVHWVWKHAMAEPSKHSEWKIKRLPALFSKTTSTDMAPEAFDGSEMSLRKSKRQRLFKIRCPRYSVQFPFCATSWNVDTAKLSKCEEGTRTRPHQQQWKLRTRQPKICPPGAQPGQPAENSHPLLQSNRVAIWPNGRIANAKYGNDQGGDLTFSGGSGRKAKEKLAHNLSKARLYDIRNAGPRNRYTVSGKLVHNCGYGGSVGALKAMGALEMGLQEHELSGLIQQWRSANPNIVRLWWDVDRAVKTCISERKHTEIHGITFSFQSGMLFITLPSGRRLAYVKPRIGENQFGGQCITYEGVGGTKKWDRLDSYGPKFVENIVQATARDILSEAMLRLNASGYQIVMHVHDEVVIEAPETARLADVCAIMGQTPSWAEGLLLRADGYVTDFYKKD